MAATLAKQMNRETFLQPQRHFSLTVFNVVVRVQVSGRRRKLNLKLQYEMSQTSTALVFRPDSPPTRSRRSIDSGGDSSSMLTSMEGNALQAFSKENNFLPHCVEYFGGLVSMIFTHLMLSFKCRMADCYALYTTVHYTLLHTFHCYIH
jgi:hypothetical protein